MNGILVPTLDLYCTYSAPKNFVSQNSSAVLMVSLVCLSSQTRYDLSYTLLEELPEHHSEDGRRQGIEQHHLSPDTKPEKAKVGWMSEISSADQ